MVQLDLRAERVFLKYVPVSLFPKEKQEYQHQKLAPNLLGFVENDFDRGRALVG